MKIVCAWCTIVLIEVQNVETDEDYTTPFICKPCCEEVFEEGTTVDIAKAYAVIEGKGNIFMN